LLLETTRAGVRCNDQLVFVSALVIISLNVVDSSCATIRSTAFVCNTVVRAGKLA
jgi:hypothetical protein